VAELIASEAFLAAAESGSEVMHGDTTSYLELRERVAANAAALGAHLPAGGFVLLAMAPDIESVVAYLSVMRAGLIAVPVGAGSGTAVIERILDEARPAARIGSFDALAPKLASVPEWRCEPAGGPTPAAVRPIPNADAAALVLYTSGTTAAPKGVVLSHRNLAANTASILAAIPLRRGDVSALVLPLHHSFGLSVLHTALAAGARLVPAADFAFPAESARLLAAAGTTVFAGVPFHFGALLDRRTGFDRDGMPDLRCAMVAGGAMPPRLIASFQERFPDADLHVMYGQTEAAARLSSLPPSELPTRVGSVGKGIPGVELAVLGPEGKAVAPGEIGEIYARGENVMRGYLGDPAASAEALTPWGLRTRDLGRTDADGYLYVVGRRSEFAKVNGYRIGLVGVESAIESCTGIAEAVVLSVDDALTGESLVAEVAFEHGGHADQSVLQRHLREHLSPIERPREIRVVDSVSRTASGKKIRWRG
jgi:long-chain acyl-CoA synthetase